MALQACSLSGLGGGIPKHQLAEAEPSADQGAATLGRRCHQWVSRPVAFQVWEGEYPSTNLPKQSPSQTKALPLLLPMPGDAPGRPRLRHEKENSHSHIAVSHAVALAVNTHRLIFTSVSWCTQTYKYNNVQHTSRFPEQPDTSTSRACQGVPSLTGST